MGYKVRHMENDLLNKLDILSQSRNARLSAVPAHYEVLMQTIPRYRLLPSCGFHRDETVHHCPVTECHAFWFWYQMINGFRE